MKVPFPLLQNSFLCWMFAICIQNKQNAKIDEIEMKFSWDAL